MKLRLMATIALAAIAIGTGGCVIAIGNSTPRTECGTDCARADDSTVIAEIDAASRLFSDSDKTDVYMAIARRPHLSGKAQNHLVRSAMRNIFSDTSKESVLLAVIENPCFNDAGKKAVLSNLNSLFSDSRKKRVLKAINDREMQLPPVQVETTVEITAQTEIQ